jgi:hypothetical protein
MNVRHSNCDLTLVAVNLNKSEAGFSINNMTRAKKNRMYKDLNMNLNLKEMFSDYNFKDLMQIKKLHLLYANHKKNASTQQQNLPSQIQ